MLGQLPSLTGSSFFRGKYYHIKEAQYMLVLLIDHLQKNIWKRRKRGEKKKQFRAYKYRKLQNLTHQGELKGKKGGPSLKWFIETTWVFFFSFKGAVFCLSRTKQCQTPSRALAALCFWNSHLLFYWFFLLVYTFSVSGTQKGLAEEQGLFYGGMNQ